MCIKDNLSKILQQVNGIELKDSNIKQMMLGYKLQEKARFLELLVPIFMGTLAYLIHVSKTK